MSTDRDTTRVVRSWLQTDEHESADRVLDAVLDQLDTTPQRRATRWPARRLPDMNTFVKFGLAAAAVVVAALLGFNYLVAPNIGVSGPGDPTPTPTAPDPSPENMPGSGALDPGAYRITDESYTPVELVITVPAGWHASDTGAVGKNKDSLGELGMAAFVVTHVYGDACDSEGTLTEIGPTADDLVAALVAEQNVDVTGPTDVTIDGYPARGLDLAFPPGLDVDTCRNPGLNIQIWADEAEINFFAIPVGHTASVYVADIDGQRVVITTDTGPEATEEDIAERDAIVDSIRIVP
jgi:hypothetical protein